MSELLSLTHYDREAIAAALEPVFVRRGWFDAMSHRGARVLLKPNFVVPAPRHDASTTHPEFYLAVAELLLSRGFQVGIGESPAIGSCAKALKAHGVLEHCLRRGIRVVEFKTPRVFAGVPGDKHFSTLSVAAELEQWDSIVNLPKLKTHQQFTFTGATKNLYGCVVGKRKFVRHNLCKNDPVRFARMVLANAARVGCVAHIADGIEALHVKGPRGGRRYPLGVVSASENFLDPDWMFCELTGLDPMATPLFEALGRDVTDQIATRCRPTIERSGFSAVTDFVHAPLIHISFSPWAVARSGYRTLKFQLGSRRSR